MANCFFIVYNLTKGRYDAMFRKNEIKVEQEIEKNCFAYGNRMYLERAVNNYLMNAFHHSIISMPMPA